MSHNHDDNPHEWNALGRFFHWLNRLGEENKLTWVLGAVCLLVLALNFTFSGKGHYAAENIIGFYALYGFVSFSFIIFAVKVLRAIIKRPEDYYGDMSVDREEYPQAGTERIDHHVD